MFMSVESHAEIETLRAAAPKYASLETAADADAAAELDALRGFFARARDATRAGAEKAREFFPDHRVATAPLAARVVEQRVGAALDAVVSQAPPPPSSSPTDPGRSFAASFLAPSSPTRRERRRAAIMAAMAPRR